MRLGLLLPLLALAACNGGKDPEPSDDTDSPPADDTADTAGGGADGNDDITTAEDLTDSEISEVGFVALAEGVISAAGDRDFYAIELEAGVPYVLYTLAWDETTDTVVLDTVVRLYDSAGDFLAENDDMIFRFRETDSGLWFMPETSGTYYAEVLEFGDWAGESASGGRDYEYVLGIGRFELSEHEGMNESIAELMANTTLPDPADTALAEDADPVFYGGLFSSYDVHFLGSFQAAGDQDWYPVNIREEDPDDDGYTPEPYFFMSTALWPNYGGTPRMSVYSGAGDLLASSTNLIPGAETAIVFITDPGILLKVDEGQDYYIVMEEDSGAATPDGFYSGTYVNYLPSLATLEEEGDNNDDQATADLTITERSDTTDGLFFIGVWGELPSDDAADWFKIDKADVEGMDGKFISVVVQSLTVGSALDPKVKLVDPDGNVVAEASVDSADATVGDPTIVDFEYDADTNLFVVVEADGRDGPDTQCNYLVGLYVSDEDLFE